MITQRESVRLKRDCVVIQVPSGELANLDVGHEVEITQALGGSYTLLTEEGEMVRLGHEDADAIGKEVPKPPEIKVSDLSVPKIRELSQDQLRTVYDPEIPVNMVDLGLIYKLEVEQAEQDYKVLVDMTLTAPGCGMGDVLRQEAQKKISQIPHVAEVLINIVLEPAWEQSMMSEEARLQLGLL